MKKIKNITPLFVLALILLVSSCSEDDYVAPYGDFSSFTWWSTTSGEEKINDVVKSIKVNKFIAFKDLSRRANSHKWEISEGTAFLTPGFNELDTLNYSRYIKPGLSTTETLAFVLFTEAGEKEVRLTNTFKDSVAESINVDGVWKVDKLITVTVTD